VVHVRNFLPDDRFTTRGGDRRRRLRPYFGQIEPWKGVRTLVQAMKRVGGQRLIVAGEGPERKALERLAGEGGSDVLFTGRLSWGISFP